MHTTAFNYVDDLLMDIEHPEDPWSVHLEVHVSGHFDETRLRAAIAATSRLHPMARARMRTCDADKSLLHWEVTDSADSLFLDVVNAETEADITVARERLISIQVPTSVAPAFYTTLVHHPDGDWLIVNASHVLTDGLGTFRLLTSILRQYSGQPDPVPHFDSMTVRDLRQLIRPKSLADCLGRTKALLNYCVNIITKPSIRVAGRAATRSNSDAMHGGYGTVQLALSAEQTARFMAQRQEPSTVNDLLLGTLSLAILRWNDQLGAANRGQISVHMPVNVRPRDWWFEIVGNYTSYCVVFIPSSITRTLPAVLSHVTQQTQRYKEIGAASIFIEFLHLSRSRPAILKAQLRDIYRIAQRKLTETTTLSNLGLLPTAPRVGDAGHVLELFFSPPAPMPKGLSLGAASMGDRLFLSLRYRKALFDAERAHQFMAVLLQEMSVLNLHEDDRTHAESSQEVLTRHIAQEESGSSSKSTLPVSVLSAVG